MEKETISQLFFLLVDRKKDEDAACLTAMKIRKCRNEKGLSYCSCQFTIGHSCNNVYSFESLCKRLSSIDEKISILVQIHGLEFAKAIGATRNECEEWLRIMNASSRRDTGENNPLYEAFAKGLGIKL